MRICFPLGTDLFTSREVGTLRKGRSMFGSYLENLRLVQQIGFRTKMWDVGCDRMVFAINSALLLVLFNSKFNKWSLDQGQKTINPLISSFRKDY